MLDSIQTIKDSFIKDYLITFEQFGKTEAKTLKIGWKFFKTEQTVNNKKEKNII